MTRRTVAEVNERLQDEARARAQEHFTNRVFTGRWSPDPDVERWPPVFRQAFQDEMRRLEAARARRPKGGPG